MKKVLVTGAGGSIGSYVLKYLLSEGKYEITALDLRTKNSIKVLKKYRRRINIIYGDINDSVLMDALVKEMDYIIHLAGVLPPLADIKKSINELVEYNGTENIVKAINFNNPKCMLIYASTTSIYGNIENASIKSKTKIDEFDYYSKSKLKIENMIIKKVKNYSIIRFPLILTNPKNNSFMYNMKRNTLVEAITDNDAGYLLASSLEHESELNKKIWNAGGGEATTAYYAQILANVLNIYGISFRYLLHSIFIDRNFYGHIYSDSDELNKILDFRSDSLKSYYMRLKRNTKYRQMQVLLAKPFICILNHKVKKIKET